MLAYLRHRRELRAAGRARGFTLLELVISVTLLSTIMVLMYQSLGQTIETRNLVQDELQGPKVANAILAQIFKDFRYIYYGGLQGDAGFRGKAIKMAGMDADRVAFITARRTRTVGTEDDGRRTDEDRESYLTEVGYACRPHPKYSHWLELWRREDYFVDSKPTEGGFYSLVYDKIRNFRMRFFPIPEEATEKQGLEEWDSAQKKGIPYAILLKIEFDVSEPAEGETYEPDEIDPIHRIILLRGGYNIEWSNTAAPPTTGNPGQPGR